MNSVWADVILVLHLGFVLFVVGGFALILLGAWRGWAWIRSPLFRYAHLGAIGFVAAEALLGIACPLTVWEDALRGSMTGQGFIQRWVGSLLFYDLPAWVFTCVYVAFAALVALTLWYVPPQRRKGI